MDDRRVAVVVEDDEDIRGLMVALLGQSGFEVYEAASGTDGVRAVEQNDPVLVTVDLGLPDIDGYEVTRRVRRFSDAYVVMLTARTEEIDTLMGLDAGADDYLTKPFRPRELRARVEAMLRRPRTTDPAPGADPAANGASAGTGQGSGAGTAGGTVQSEGPTSAPEGSANGAGGEASAVEIGPTSSAAETAEGEAPAEGTGASSLQDSADFHLELDELRLYPNVHQVDAEGREIALTPTEFILLETLLRSGRVVRSKTELSRIIRGDAPDSGSFVSEADERTVEVHVGNMRRKIGDAPRNPRWVQTVRGVGYRVAGTPQAKG